MTDGGKKPGEDPDTVDLAGCRPATRELFETVMLDLWPGDATVTDFGLSGREQYEALYYPLRAGEITPAQLDAALGDGAELTRLARQAPSNPHPGVTFRTAWDELGDRLGEAPPGRTDGGGRAR